MTVLPQKASLDVVPSAGWNTILDKIQNGTDFDIKPAGIRVAAPTSGSGTSGDPWNGSAIQTAIDDLPTPGGTVLVPAGVWAVSATITIPSDVTLRGAGRSTRIQASVNVVILEATTQSHIIIKDLYLVGNDRSNPATTGIRLVDCQNCRVEGCFTENCYIGVWLAYVVSATRSNDNIITRNSSDSDRYGIYLEGNRNIISLNRIYNSSLHAIILFRSTGLMYDNVVSGNVVRTSTGGSGIVLGRASRTVIDGNDLQDGPGDAIILQDSPHNLVSNNLCFNWRSVGIGNQASNYNTYVGNVCVGNALYGGMFIELLETDAVSVGTVIIGNVFQGNTGWGLKVRQSEGAVIVGNICDGNTEDGIEVEGKAGATVYDVSRNLIADNVCRNNAKHGIQVTDSNNNVIRGNYCYDNDSGDTNSFDGIILDGDTETDDNHVSGNYCFVTAAGAKQRYGINIATATCDSNVVSDNSVKQGGRTGGLNDAGTATAIRRNTGFVTENRGTAVIANGTSSIAVAHGLAAVPVVAIASGRDLETDELRVSARDGTNITLAVPANVTAARTVDWIAEV